MKILDSSTDNELTVSPFSRETQAKLQAIDDAVGGLILRVWYHKNENKDQRYAVDINIKLQGMHSLSSFYMRSKSPDRCASKMFEKLDAFCIKGGENIEVVTIVAPARTTSESPTYLRRLFRVTGDRKAPQFTLNADGKNNSDLYFGMGVQIRKDRDLFL